MATSQKVQIDTFDYGASLTVPTLGALSTGTTITDGTASTCNEQTADSGVYIADFVGADASHLIPAGTYRLRTTVNGKPLKRFVTFTGVDGELVYARSERAAELDSSSLAAVNAQVVDALSVDTYAELSAPPAATSSLKDKITWLFMYARNKVTQTALARTLYRDDTTTVAGTSATSDNGTTFTKGEDT